MNHVFLTPEGIEKLKIEILDIKMVQIPRVKRRLQNAVKYGNQAEISEANAELNFYMKRIPKLEEMVLSAIYQRHSNPIYEDRLLPEQIIEDEINLWRQMIEKEIKDYQVLMHYETPVTQVALLVANQCMKLESDIEKHKKELAKFINEAKLISKNIFLNINCMLSHKSE